MPEVLKKIQSGRVRSFESPTISSMNNSKVFGGSNLSSHVASQLPLKRATLSPIKKRTSDNSPTIPQNTTRTNRSSSLIKKGPTSTSHALIVPLADDGPCSPKEILRRQIYAVNHMMKVVEDRKWELLNRGTINTTTAYTL